MSETTAPKPRKRRLRLFAIIATVSLALVLAVFLLPTHVARWVLDSKFEELGLQASGVETIDIDLWHRKIQFGPITLGALGAKPAQLERFGIAFSLSELFERRGLSRDAVIEGVELEVFRDAEGRISLNGIDLFSLLQSDQTEQEDSEARPWGLGIRTFTLSKSQVTFTQPGGSELVMALDRLQLDNFRTWTPETPGRFALSGRINEMGVEIEGEAAPFADRITVQATSKLSAIDIKKVERFTGPLQLSRGDGTMRAALKHQAELSPDGTIKLSNAGDIVVDGLSIALPEGPEIQFDDVDIKLDTQKTLHPDHSASLGGSLKLAGKQARLQLPDGPSVDLAKASLAISDIGLKADPAQKLAGGLSLAFRATQGTAKDSVWSTGFASLAVDSVLRNAKFDPAATSLSADADIDITITSPRTEGPTQTTAEQVTLRFKKGAISNDNSDFSASGAVSLDASDLRAATDGEPGTPVRTVSLATLNFTGSHLKFSAPADAPLSWQTAFDLQLGKASAETGSAYAETLTVEKIALGRVTLDSALKAAIGNLAVTGLTATGSGLEPLPAGDAKGASDSTHTARIGSIAAEGLEYQPDGTINAGRIGLGALSFNSAGSRKVDARLAGLELRALSLSPDQRIATEALRLSGADISADDGEDLRLQFGEIAFEKLSAASDPAFAVEMLTIKGLDLLASTKLLPAKSTPAADSDATTTEAARKPTQKPVLPVVSVGKLVLSDPAKIALTDKRQSPPVAVQAIVKRLELRDLDTTKADTKPAVALAATINEFTDLTVDGWLNPFGDDPNFSLKTAFANLELPTFSPYAAKHLGVNLETGRLSAEADGKMIDGDLDIATKLDIRTLKFSPLSPEDAKRLSATAGVPIETAVGLLEDKDGRIELSIPVKGDYRNPNFDLDQVIGKAVGSAIASTIGTAIKVIFPPALLISVFDAATSGSSIEFAPAPFDAGATTLQPKGNELLAALTKLLAERPKLIVTVCGRATAADLNAVLAPEADAIRSKRQADHEQAMQAYRTRLQPLIQRGLVDKTGKPLKADLKDPLPQAPTPPVLDKDAIVAGLAEAKPDEIRDRLTKLAADRTRIIRSDLATRQALQKDRIAECRPVYDPKDTGIPRAEFSL